MPKLTPEEEDLFDWLKTREGWRVARWQATGHIGAQLRLAPFGPYGRFIQVDIKGVSMTAMPTKDAIAFGQQLVAGYKPEDLPAHFAMPLFRGLPTKAQILALEAFAKALET